MTPNPTDQLVEHIAAIVADFDSLPAPTEGWGVFNTDEPLRCGIERIDEEERFADDQAATDFVIRKALEGSGYHKVALTIHTLCNELRRLEWGPEWVHSRCGPAATPTYRWSQEETDHYGGWCLLKQTYGREPQTTWLLDATFPDEAVGKRVRTHLLRYAEGL